MNCPHHFTASETGNVLVSWHGDEAKQIFVRAEDLYGANPRDVALWMNKAAKIGFDARAAIIRQVLEIKNG